MKFTRPLGKQKKYTRQVSGSGMILLPRYLVPGHRTLFVKDSCQLPHYESLHQKGAFPSSTTPAR